MLINYYSVHQSSFGEDSEGNGFKVRMSIVLPDVSTLLNPSWGKGYFNLQAGYFTNSFIVHPVWYLQYITLARLVRTGAPPGLPLEVFCMDSTSAVLNPWIARGLLFSASVVPLPYYGLLSIMAAISAVNFLQFGTHVLYLWGTTYGGQVRIYERIIHMYSILAAAEKNITLLHPTSTDNFSPSALVNWENCNFNIAAIWFDGIDSGSPGLPLGISSYSTTVVLSGENGQSASSSSSSAVTAGCFQFYEYSKCDARLAIFFV
ncbi:hypothetical protein QBC37DRAFT_483202 [Rhypophila decipiens]|uniref:Uncharacterized protein n=1 Tax=Rhypophila decipiens TaxID=261697 RepID=A0AAN6Y5Y6_9PEZI|nr:hypothetical protein QBC37DRAFT_483202 [Rhypophila decipiens]